jgi:hypothetical protein
MPPRVNDPTLDHGSSLHLQEEEPKINIKTENKI